jgi:hypothetical protein
MSTQENILATISAGALCDAMRDFPPASLSDRETLEGETVTVNGRRVMVTFKRHSYRHYKHVNFDWRMESARYLDE